MQEFLSVQEAQVRRFTASAGPCGISVSLEVGLEGDLPVPVSRRGPKRMGVGGRNYGSTSGSLELPM
jgi:hypothetical protein